MSISARGVVTNSHPMTGLNGHGFSLEFIAMIIERSQITSISITLRPLRYPIDQEVRRGMKGRFLCKSEMSNHKDVNGGICICIQKGYIMLQRYYLDVRGLNEKGIFCALDRMPQTKL